MGVQEMPNGGHYGITQFDDEGKIYYSAIIPLICNSVSRKIHMYGDGSVTDSRTPSTTSTTIYGQTTTATRAVDQIKLESAIGYMPSGTSIQSKSRTMMGDMEIDYSRFDQDLHNRETRLRGERR